MEQCTFAPNRGGEPDAAAAAAAAAAEAAGSTTETDTDGGPKTVKVQRAGPRLPPAKALVSALPAALNSYREYRRNSRAERGAARERERARAEASSPEPAGAEPAADGHIAEEGETSADEVAVEGIVLAGRQL